MKNIIKIVACLCVLVLAILLCASFTNKSDEVNYNFELTEKYMNGHYYVVGTKGAYGISVIHSPTCRCGRY